MNKSGAGRARVQLRGEGRASSEIVRCEISQLSGAGINLDPGIAQHGWISHSIETRLLIKILKKCGNINPKISFEEKRYGQMPERG